MVLSKLISKRSMIASLATAALLTSIIPGAVSYGAAAGAGASGSVAVEFQIGSNKSVDYRGEHALAAAPYVQSGNAMVPVKAMAEGLQADLTWNAATKEIVLTRSGLTVHLKVGSEAVAGTLIKNSKLPTKVTVIKGAAFVPAKSVAQLIGATTAWDAKQKKVVIGANEDAQDAVSLHYTFEQGDEGWKGDFADLPVVYDADIYRLLFARELLPTAGNTTNYGLKFESMNRSDDLFMFATKRIEGLTPNTTYKASLSFILYTDQAGGMMGVGGAPGEAVSIKAGFVNKEPGKVESNDSGDPYYRMNVDKGNQKTEGEDMKIVGSMVQPDDSLEGFQPVAMSCETTLKSNAQGELYVIIGSDSGYEGLTTFYLDEIKVNLAP